MSVVDSDLVLFRDGTADLQPYWMEETSIDDPPTIYRIVRIIPGD